VYGDFTFVIVVGSQRSGTTLTAQMLGAHSSCLLVDETDGLYDWFYQLAGGTSKALSFERLIEKSCQKYVSSKGRFVESKDDSRCVKHIVLKAPNLTYCWDAISRVFNRVKVIYVHRDIRSIVVSMKRLSRVPIVQNQIRLMSQIPHVTEKYSEEYSWLLSKSVPEHVKMALVALIKNSFEQEFLACGLPVQHLYYEELVMSPNNVMEKALSYIGLDYEDECVDYVGLYKGRAPGDTKRNKGVSKKSLKLWQTMLDDSEIEDIEAVVKYFLERHVEFARYMCLQ
jgi:hypothetical protein